MTNLEKVLKEKDNLISLPKESCGNLDIANFLKKKLSNMNLTKSAIKSLEKISEHDILIWILDNKLEEGFTICSHDEYIYKAKQYAKKNKDYLIDYLFLIGNKKAIAYSIANSIRQKEEVDIEYNSLDIIYANEILILFERAPECIEKYMYGEQINVMKLHGSLPRKYRRRLLKALNKCENLYENMLKDKQIWTIFFSVIHPDDYPKYKNVYMAAFKLKNNKDNCIEKDISSIIDDMR